MHTRADHHRPPTAYKIQNPRTRGEEEEEEEEAEEEESLAERKILLHQTKYIYRSRTIGTKGWVTMAAGF